MEVKDDKGGLVYVIIDMTNGMCYVGQTTKTLDERFERHACRNKLLIDQMIHEHGRENFNYHVLIECESADEMNEWEKRGIELFNSKFPNGYNKTNGGAGTLGFKRGPLTPEHCQKISETLTGKPRSDATKKKISDAMTGEKNHQFGHPHSPEHNRKIGESLKGKLLGRVSPFLGCEHTEATKQKMSENQMGENNSFFGHAAVNRWCVYPNLEATMKEYGNNYPALAKRIGVSYQTFRRRMHGEIDFKDSEKVILVDYYQKPAEYLFVRAES